ncbi:MAG: TonB-dependent receptor [Acidobacteria bacterium]|nr:TonB-dependent receptor [Acidobacteriota bacterium]
MRQKCNAIFLFIIIGLSCFTLAQSPTATISGVVKDASGGVLPGASVRVKNLDTGVGRDVVSDDLGRYTAPSLSLGNYEVEASLSGFQTEVRTGIGLTIGREALVDFSLKVGEITDRVVVSGEAPLVNVSQAELGGLVDRERIDTLPLNGRSFQQLALLQPGAVLATNMDSQGARGRGIKISAGGVRHRMSQFMIDGVEVMDARNNGAAGTLQGVETVREFKVITNNYSAEFGRNAGMLVSVSTRSGTNEFHGSVYEFLRNDNLDARNFFDAGGPPEFKRHQFGFSLEGPIRRNKTFFLGNYEGLREALGITSISNVPDANARAGILPGRAPFAVNEKAKPYLAKIPLPTPGARNFGNGVGEFISASTNTTNGHYVTLRGDHNFTEKDSLFGRYTLEKADISLPSGLPISETVRGSRTVNIAIEETKIIRAHLLNQFRFGLNKSDEDSDVVPLVQYAPELSFVPGKPVGGIIVPGTANLGLNAAALHDETLLDTLEWVDNVTYTRGEHSMKFGFSAKQIHFKRQVPFRDNGEFTFASLFDFLTLGNLTQMVAVGLKKVDERETRQNLFGFYFQDDWKAAPHLTLNLGLRYEFITAPNEVNGIQGFIKDPFNDPVFTVGKDAKMLQNPSLLSLGPRVGIAWDPFGTGKTSVRSGFGIFYDQVLPRDYADSIDDIPPFKETVELFNISAQGVFPNIPLSILVSPTILSIQSLVDYDDVSTPYVMHYNLSFQQEVLPQTVVTAAYAGSLGRHLQRKVESNIRRFQVVDGRKFFPSPAASNPRLNPNFASMGLVTFDGNSHYHSFQLGLNRRMDNGFIFQASYTLGKVIDDMSESSETVSVVGHLQRSLDPFDRTADRGLANFDVRHSFSFNWIYPVPLTSSVSGVKGKLLGGWQLSGILGAATGSPFSAELGFDRARSGQLQSQRPLLLGNNNNPTHPGNPDAYYDVTAFGLPPAGFLGGNLVARNAMIGPGRFTTDFSLTKNTAIGDKARLEFRSEFFNIFNRANFRGPFAGSGAGGATRPLNSAGELLPQSAKLTATTGTARQIQFGLRLIF